MNQSDSFKIGGIFEATCYGSDGQIKWSDTAKNLVTDVGLNHILDVVLHGSTAVSPWYMGLKNAGEVAAADTLVSHSGWTENANYTGDRKEYVEAAASSKSTTNSANKASFAISVNAQTIDGAFICSVASGTTGILLCAADFTGGEKTCDNGDTLQVEYSISAADA